MTRADEIHEWIERTTKAQGLPYYIEDPATLQRVARLLLQGIDDTPPSPPGGAVEVSRTASAAAPDRVP